VLGMPVVGLSFVYIIWFDWSKQIIQNNKIMATKIIDKYKNYEANYQFYKSKIFQAKNQRL